MLLTYFFSLICLDLIEGFDRPGGAGWKAPEQLLDGRKTFKADLFSLGCVLYFVITGGSHPFGQVIDQRDKNILENKINLSQLANMPEAFHLISLLLHPEPKLR
ncbi:Tyrosine-protein kinase [Parasponia andersonii]|uniref:Tyrosine-protein kinase n=1 Tax=Parasponia andersonii TaxID=3476 RepID=A0A2P5CCX3_PARAD|nr:Tyrosine-protein kinase [Parasponia andersonii]